MDTPEPEANLAEGDDLSLEVEADEDQDLEQDDGAEGAADEGEEAEELEDFDHDGKTLKVPKAVKPMLMMHGDYTKKTMELAEQRRDLEARQANLAREDDAILNARADLASFNKTIQEYEAVDWNWLAEQDRLNGTAERETHWTRYQKMLSDRATLGQQLNNTLSHRQAEAQRIHATRLQENRQALAKEIPGYSPDLLGKLQTYAKTAFGIDPREVGEDLNPAAMKVLHRAFTLDQAAKTKGQVQKIAQGQKTQPAPTLRGSGGKFSPGADTKDFAAFEKLAQAKG